MKTMLFGTAALAMAVPLHAQTAQPDAASSLRTVEREGEIIVTARNYVPEGAVSANKADIPLIQTPQSVSVITRDQIDLLNFVDAQQAVRYTAGVFGENYGPDARYDFFTVRGFTPKQYIDGLAAPISTSIYSVGVDLYGFQSLDLLKGPASTLYGNTPPGGIFNQVSRRAEAETSGELRVQGGTDNFAEVAGTVTGTVANGLTARFTGLVRDRDLVADATSFKRVYAAPTATWAIGPDTQLTGLAYYQYDKGEGGNGGFLPVQGTLLPNPNGRIDHRTNLGDPRDVFERRQFSAGYEFSHAFTTGVTFRSNGRWNQYRERVPIGIYATGIGADLRTVTQSNFSYAEDVHSFAADNRVEANFATGFIGHTLIAGVDYRNVDNQAAFGFVGAGTVDAFDPVYTTPQAGIVPGYPTAFNDQRLKQTGIYVQEQLRLGDLFITLGGRQDWIESRRPEVDFDQDRFTWRAGVNYVTTSGIAPYVSYSTSFEPVLGTDAATGEAFKPSSGDQWETGVKFDGRALSPDIRIFATAALFRIDQRDVVTTQASTIPVFGTQVGRVRVQGGELEVVARIRDQLTVNGSYSYNDSEVLESAVAAEVGSPLPTTPEHKASAFVNYDFQRGPLAGFGIGLGGRYTSSSAGSLPGPFNPVVYRGEAATLMDAILSYDIPGWRFAINGSNILDNRYVARCSQPVGCFYGAPRQVLGTVTRRF
ncbi:iron complex outermembrane receptor protein [Sphingomonas jejuensis]|uniref:Iron complex outermembrane receptor protein n=1 Tax=Sphingomonas jejuensis TaxID=904715 RepID=A0ABX0XLK9_9SPHN|nr:TonB-dependent siderophore receptor [Sphingomonas jejuensis]NJC34258.1 iron complex outermembrane receptor protein [Sphingomonas jejuensis]